MIFAWDFSREPEVPNRSTRHPVPGCWALLVGMAAGTWCVSTVNAGEFSYGLGYFGEYSDNIRLAPKNPEHEWTNIAVAGMAYQELGPTLAAHVDAEAQYYNYTQQTYTDAPRYYADAAAIWAISPQRLNWVVVDRADQSLLNSSRPATPDNLTNTNVLSTGPDFFMHFGPVNTMVLGGRYGRASYADGGTSNDRYSGSARWLYESNSTTNYSLNYEYLRVFYDDAVLNDNYQRHDLYLQTDIHEANNLVLLDVGATHIFQERGGETRGPAFRLNATRRLTTESTASLLAASEFLDPAADLLTTVTSATSVTGALTMPTFPATRDVTGDFYKTRRLEGYYTYTGATLGAGTGLYYRDVNYQTTPMDRTEVGLRQDVTLNPAGLLSTMLYARYVQTEYHNFVRNDADTQIGLLVLYRLTPNLRTTAELRRTWRNSTDPAQEYTNNLFLVSLVYVTNPMLNPIRR